MCILNAESNCTQYNSAFKKMNVKEPLSTPGERDRRQRHEGERIIEGKRVPVRKTVIE